MNSTGTYNEIDNDTILKELEIIREYFNEFKRYYKYPENVRFCRSVRKLVDVIIRTDKRRDYFNYFHNNMKINECKSIALYAYWIVKFHPFVVDDAAYENELLGFGVNEAFAIFLIMAMLRKIHDIKNIPMDFSDAKSYCGKLMYSFRFRNIGIDAIILLVDSIGKDTLFKTYEPER